MTKSSQGSKSSASTPSYAVAVGRRPGVYSSWAEAERQVSGYSNNVHQKFDNVSDARAFVGQAQSSGTVQITQRVTETTITYRK